MEFEEETSCTHLANHRTQVSLNCFVTDRLNRKYTKDKEKLKACSLFRCFNEVGVKTSMEPRTQLFIFEAILVLVC